MGRPSGEADGRLLGLIVGIAVVLLRPEAPRIIEVIKFVLHGTAPGELEGAFPPVGIGATYLGHDAPARATVRAEIYPPLEGPPHLFAIEFDGRSERQGPVRPLDI